jgi:hypothetical protein
LPRQFGTVVRKILRLTLPTKKRTFDNEPAAAQQPIAA